MEVIETLCIGSLFTPILTGKHKSHPFTWDRLTLHKRAFESVFNHEDAQCALQLSFMVSSSNIEHTKFSVPPWLRAIPLRYDVCPFPIIYENLPASTINASAILGYIIYYAQYNLLFIVFTGTSNLCLMSMDINYPLVDVSGIDGYVEGEQCHRGIYGLYMSIRNVLRKELTKYMDRKPQIIITGHSLGGALSQLCALDLAHHHPINYAFGSPLLFNEVGATRYDNEIKQGYRVANLSDLITMLPIPIMPNGDAFCHAGQLVHFQKNLKDFIDNHSLAYAEVFDIIPMKH